MVDITLLLKSHFGRDKPSQKPRPVLRVCELLQLTLLALIKRSRSRVRAVLDFEWDPLNETLDEGV